MTDPTPEPVKNPVDSAELAVVTPIRAEDLPLIPAYQEVRDLAAMAVTLANADCVPGPLRRKPNDVFMVLLTGRDIGVKLTTALRMLHVIDGQVTVPPKLKAALVRERGLGRIWPDESNDATHATWYGVRADDPGVTYLSTVTWEDAARVVSWTDKNSGTQHLLVEKDNWVNYPQRMLSWRALGYLLDDAFSEVATGLYSPDEIGAVTDEEGQPLDVIDVDPFPGMRGGRRPDVEDPPLGEAEIGLIWTRLAALPMAEVEGKESAKDAVREKWKEQRLPPPDHLRASQHQKAVALLDWVERRAKAGEWGTWPPEGAVEATDGSQPGDGPGDASGEPGGGEGGLGEVSAGTADPAMCLHPEIDEVDGLRFCRACGEAMP